MAPLAILEFAKICSFLGKSLILYSHEDDAVYSFVHAQRALFTQFAEDYSPGKPLSGGKHAGLQNEIKRLKWFEGILQKLQVSLAEVAFVFNGEEDLGIAKKCAYRVSFSPNKKICASTSALSVEQDCGFLSLLFFGRDLGGMRHGFS